MTIGIFDSGVGGITVLKKLRAYHPMEDFIYLADNARLPYGEKTPAELRGYFQEVLAWMLERKVEKIIIACHTSSCWVLPYPAPIPIMGTIEPLATCFSPAADKKIGLLGTSATVRSRMYEKIYPSLLAVACPRLVPLIEAQEDPTEALQEYLEPLIAARVDYLIYGCTHYGWLDGMIRALIPPSMHIIDPADCIAQSHIFSGKGTGSVEFHVTGDHHSFERALHRFYDDALYPQCCTLRCA